MPEGAAKLVQRLLIERHARQLQREVGVPDLPAHVGGHIEGQRVEAEIGKVGVADLLAVVELFDACVSLPPALDRVFQAGRTDAVPVGGRLLDAPVTVVSEPTELAEAVQDPDELVLGPEAWREVEYGRGLRPRAPRRI